MTARYYFLRLAAENSRKTVLNIIYDPFLNTFVSSLYIKPFKNSVRVCQLAVGERREWQSTAGAGVTIQPVTITSGTGSQRGRKEVKERHLM